MGQDSSEQGSQRPNRLASIDVPLVAAVAALPAVYVAPQLPQDLLLPAIAAVAFAVAAMTAVAGLLARTPRRSAAVTIWDFAGACVLIGIAASAFSEPLQVSQLLGVASTTP